MYGTFLNAHCAISLHIPSLSRIAESQYLEGALMRGAGDAALNDGNPEVGGRQVDISGRWFDGQAAVQGLCGHNPAGQAVRGQAVPESASQ